MIRLRLIGQSLFIKLAICVPRILLIGVASLLVTNSLAIIPDQAVAAPKSSTTQQFAQPCGNPGTPGPVQHVVWIWMENESFNDVIGNPDAPYQTSLANQCGTPTNFANESHGSLDNYIAATDGQNILGTSFVNDCLPNPSANYCVSPSQSIFSQVQAAGETWKGYAEDMPSNCYQGNSGNYAARHNPAVYYTGLSSCSQNDIPMGSAATQTGQFYSDVENGNLPNFSFITPNLIDDAHSSSTATGDAWLSNIIPFITNGSNYQSGNTVIFITNDEGSGSDYTVDEDCSSQTLDANQPSCHIPTIVVAPYTPAGTVDNTFYTHYSMLRTTEELLGLPLLGLAASANSMTANFNLGPISDGFAPPSPPTNLTATATTPAQVNLSWTASSPGNAPITGYQISRNGAVIATTSGSGTAYSDTSASPGTAYDYTVEADDAVGNISAASNNAVVTTPTVVNLLANPNFANWANGLPVGWDTYGPDTTLTQSTTAYAETYSVKVATTDTSYAASGINDGSTPTITDTVAGTTYVGSCWVQDSKAITINAQLHETKQNGSSLNTAAVTALAIPKINQWYQLQVSYTAIDNGSRLPFSIYSTNTIAGGASFEIDDCSLATSFPVTTPPPPDTTPPTVPTNLVAAAVSPTQVNLSWTASTDPIGVEGYDILRNGILDNSNTGNTSYSDTGLTPNTTYTYSVLAFDAAGNFSTPSTSVSITTPPLAPPAAPTNLTATAISPTQVNLDWTASTPGSAPITGYQVTCNGAVVATVTGNSFDDTSLTPNTSYTYSVAAIDSNDLISPSSNSISVTTPTVIILPGAPSSLIATATGTNQVNLTWTASIPGTDPIAGYQITRNGVVIASTTGTATSYSDTTASLGTTYSYSVAAVDTLGNISASSNSATVTTPTVINLLPNPSFENWTNGLPIGWSTYGPDTTLTQSSNAYSGSYSVLVATTDASYAASGVSAGGTTPLINSTTAGTTYVGSCWVNASKAITLNIQFHEVTQSWVSVSPAAITSLAVTPNTWYQIQVTYTTVGNGNMLPFSIYSTNTKAGGATFEVDDCSLTSTI